MLTMMDTHYPTVDQLIAAKRSRRNLVSLAFMLTLLMVFGLAIGLDNYNPNMAITSKLGVGVAIFMAMAVPVVIWMNPIRGVQCMLLMCMVIEADGRTPPYRLITYYLPFFLNFNLIGTVYNTNMLEPVKFSPAEAIMLLTFVSWLVRSIAKRDLHWKPGAFIGAFALLITWVTVSFIHGLATGGDFLLALWEVRALYLCAAMYLLTTNVVTDRNQLKSFAWIIIVGLAVRSLLGLYAYFQLVGQITDQGIMQHDDSFMLNLLFLLPLILYFNRGPKALIWSALLCIPIGLFVDLENNRRAGIAAFIIAFAALLPIAWFLLPQRKRELSIFIVVASLFASIYLPIAWNAQGQWAFPAKAIRSQFSPDERDAGSDNYRFLEDTDLKYTRDTSPWIGVGYGKPWIEIMPLPAVSTGFLQYVAHDSVLWMWMRLGHVGFFLFILWIVQVLIKGPQICRTVSDPLTQAFGIMAILFMLMAFIYGKYDLQYANYRTMIALGFFLGLLGILPQLAAEPKGIEAREGTASAESPIDPDLVPPMDAIPSELRLFP